MAVPAERSAKKELDASAAQALKQFVRKNRPSPSVPVAASVVDTRDDKGVVPAASSESAKPSAPLGKDLEEESCPSSSASARFASDTSPLVTIDKKVEIVNVTKFAKYDIFDNVDEERIKEFEAVFSETRQQSNYDEFKKKTKKADPNKFATCNGVDTRDDGHLVLH